MKWTPGHTELNGKLPSNNFFWAELNLILKNNCSIQYSKFSNTRLQIWIMASSKSIHFSNCQITTINYKHKWVIPNFESWSMKNQDQWLQDSPFSPTQGIQMQLKILGSKPDSGDLKVFLVNRDQNPIYLSKSFLQYFVHVSGLTWRNREGRLRCHTTEVKPDHVLAISEEFSLPWSSRKDGSVPGQWVTSSVLNNFKIEPGISFLRAGSERRIQIAEFQFYSSAKILCRRTKAPIL